MRVRLGAMEASKLKCQNVRGMKDGLERTESKMRAKEKDDGRNRERNTRITGKENRAQEESRPRSAEGRRGWEGKERRGE